MRDAVSTVKHNQMLKVFDQPNIQYHSSKKSSTVAQGASFVDSDHAPGDPKEWHELYHRLELKINELNNSIDVLLRTQIVLQESIDWLSLQHKNNHHEADTKNQMILPQVPLTPRQHQFQQQQLQSQSSIRNSVTTSSNGYSTALLAPRLNSVPSDEHWWNHTNDDYEPIVFFAVVSHWCYPR